MNKISFLVTIFCLIIFSSSTYAQLDSVQRPINTSPQLAVLRLDSAAMLKKAQLKDSLKRVADSLAYLYIKSPDPNRIHQFRDSLMRLYQVYDLDFNAWASKFIKKNSHSESGKLRNRAERWIVIAVFLLIFGFAVLNSTFNKEIRGIVSSFFDQRFLIQAGSSAGFNSWPYVMLYVLFGLTMGMYLFLVSRYLQLSYFVNGFRLFLMLSVVVMLAVALKLFILRFLGFLLQINKLVKPYLSFLLLSYFHAAIIFLPLTLAFSLSPVKHMEIFVYTGALILALIIGYQLIRLSFYLIAQYQFPKLYLIIYFCALEICPILILIKALRF